MKIKIISVGKTKEEWLESALEEYRKRLKPWVSLETQWTKDDNQLMQAVAKETPIALDPQGKMFTSEEWAQFIDSSLVKEGGRLTFVIGGPEGLPALLKSKAVLVSFSRMTFTHQITRLILAEQLYRAFAILQGKPYHK